MEEIEKSSNDQIQRLELSIEEGRTSENMLNQLLIKISKVSSRCNSSKTEESSVQ